MRALNLVPWRERQRQAVLQRWQIGGLLAATATFAMVFAIEHWLAEANHGHELNMSAWQAQQQALQHKLQEAALWQTRYRQAQQVQQAWPQWQQQQWQAWRSLIDFFSVPPRGLQLSQVQWRDGQWQLQVRALSAAHVLHWQDQLQAHGIAVRAQPTPIASHLWRCPQGRLWHLHTFELSSPAPQGVRS
jgi:type IV pilus assembly protein PilN